jgi:hypothetical protein
MDSSELNRMNSGRNAHADLVRRGEIAQGLSGRPVGSGPTGCGIPASRRMRFGVAAREHALAKTPSALHRRRLHVYSGGHLH